jgi:hypothetical protein
LIYHQGKAGSSAGVPAAGEEEAEEAQDLSQACPVCLICRQGTDAYIWCGELEYTEHYPSARPIKFRWRLKHFDQLVNSSTKGNLFPALMRYAGVTK